MTALCFSTHGRFLATGGSDKLVRVWPFDTEAGGEEWGGGGRGIGGGGAGNECDGCLINTAPHTLSPRTPHVSRPTFPTPSYPHMPAGKVVIDNKERVQLTGCKASILSLQFDYQVSDTCTHIKTHAQIHTAHTHLGTPHLTCVSFVAITTGETGSSCLQ